MSHDIYGPRGLLRSCIGGSGHTRMSLGALAGVVASRAERTYQGGSSMDVAALAALAGNALVAGAVFCAWGSVRGPIALVFWRRRPCPPGRGPGLIACATL